MRYECKKHSKNKYLLTLTIKVQIKHIFFTSDLKKIEKAFSKIKVQIRHIFFTSDFKKNREGLFENQGTNQTHIFYFRFKIIFKKITTAFSKIWMIFENKKKLIVKKNN